MQSYKKSSTCAVVEESDLQTSVKRVNAGNTSITTPRAVSFKVHSHQLVRLNQTLVRLPGMSGLFGELCNRTLLHLKTLCCIRN